ncbi:MAG: hypothetical protein ABSH08_20445 [Tepidisphaeraceae bacterium]
MLPKIWTYDDQATGFELPASCVWSGAGAAVYFTVKLFPLAERKYSEPHVVVRALHLLADCPVRCLAEAKRAAGFSAVVYSPLSEAVLEPSGQLLVERSRF